MKLVGASWSFIRRPFLRRNFWIGVLSAVIADAVLWGAAYWLVSYEPELIRVITPRCDVAGFRFRTDIRSAYYVVVRVAFHQQVSEDEGRHTVLYIADER